MINQYLPDEEEEMIDPEDLEIIDEKFDPYYEPSKEELLMYAEDLGFDVKKHPDLINLAYTSMKTKLPNNWRKAMIKTTGEILFINLIF